MMYTMIANMKTIAEKNPATPIGSSFMEFNTLLRLAKQAYPESATIKAISELSGSVPAADLMMKLSALQGAIENAYRS
ncbi:MAG: hypothetical protein ACREF4_05030 [Gammaproteobacteria bacterium]